MADKKAVAKPAAKAAALKAGDSVKVNQKDHSQHGRAGVVDRLDDGDMVCVAVAQDHGPALLCHFEPGELQRA